MNKMDHGMDRSVLFPFVFGSYSVLKNGTSIPCSKMGTVYCNMCTVSLCALEGHCKTNRLEKEGYCLQNNTYGIM